LLLRTNENGNLSPSLQGVQAKRSRTK
jgi:hypothetical protein